MERRPIKTRSAAWAKWLSQLLLRAGLTPNQVSLFGIVFALLAGTALACCGQAINWTKAGVFIVAAACIQLRLLCNMLDGLMAVEGGQQSKTGDLFNDLPDRIEDVIILVGAGYAARVPMLGCGAAVAAVLTAYVRVLGGTLGVRQDFCGPMAKPHRMFVLTLTCLFAATETLLGREPRAMVLGLSVIMAGAVVTMWRRTARLVEALKAK